MTTTETVQALAIEFAGEAPKYGKLHKAGCRDLIDPESIGDCSSRVDALVAAKEATGWDQDTYEFAPCVKIK
jgi:hypothetical protein